MRGCRHMRMTKRRLAKVDKVVHNRSTGMAQADAYYSILTSAAHAPEGYKVCTVCGNIAESAAAECPYCSAYRFVDDPEHVTNTALDQATHMRTAVTDPSMYDED